VVITLKIGRKIYYDKTTGNILVDTGERQGSVIPTTIEADTQAYTALSERKRETFDLIELPFGAYSQDFAECDGYRINPDTKEIEFSYPDPNQPEAEPLHIPPMSETVNAQTEYLVDVDFRLSMVELGL
jgi:hypothetical protein